MRWSFAVVAVVVVGADETMERVMRIERMVGMMRTMVVGGWWWWWWWWVLVLDGGRKG
jgi:hypothetical protein